MEVAKAYLKKYKLDNTISFKDGKEHTVKILKAKEASIPGQNGETKNGLKVLVEEAGSQKSFFTTSTPLIKNLAKVKEGEVVSIRLKQVSKDGGFISVYIFKNADEAEDVTYENCEEEPFETKSQVEPEEIDF